MLIWFHKISKDVMPRKNVHITPTWKFFFPETAVLAAWQFGEIKLAVSDKHMELDVSVMSSKLGNAPPPSCWFKKPVEHTIVNGIWLITLHATPPAVCAGWKWNSLGEWREKPLQRNFRAPHYTLPLGTFTPFISHLMNCLHFSAFQAPHKFAPVLVSLFALGEKKKMQGGELEGIEMCILHSKRLWFVCLFKMDFRMNIHV